MSQRCPTVSTVVSRWWHVPNQPPCIIHIKCSRMNCDCEQEVGVNGGGRERKGHNIMLVVEW